MTRQRSMLMAGLMFIVSLALNPARADTAKRVYLITNHGCEDVCRSFQHNLESQGPVDFILRDVDGDVSRVAGLIKEARQLRPDLIATWGTGITLAVVGPYDAVEPSAYVTDIPVVYMYVGNPVQSKIARDPQHSGRANVAGANTAVPMNEQINLLASYRKLSKIGMLYNTDEPAAVAQADAARRDFQARGVQIIEAKLVLGKDGRPNASEIPVAIEKIADSKPDFLYHIGSTFTLEQIAEISNDAIAHDIPMFSSTEPAFRDGNVLLGLISPLASIGQVSAYQAGQILFHGKRAGDLPTPTVTHHSVLINMHAARALKLYPPMKLLQFADLVE